MRVCRLAYRSAVASDRTQHYPSVSTKRHAWALLTNGHPAATFKGSARRHGERGSSGLGLGNGVRVKKMLTKYF